MYFNISFFILETGGSFYMVFSNCIFFRVLMWEITYIAPVSVLIIAIFLRVKFYSDLIL